MPEDYEITKKEKFYEEHPNLFTAGVCAGSIALTGLIVAGTVWLYKVLGREIGKEIKEA